MIIAKQDLIIFGKLIYKDEVIRNNFMGTMKTTQEIIDKLNEKGFEYEIIEDKKEVKQETIQEKKRLKNDSNA